MTKEIIVTLQTENGFQRDFALPTDVPLAELYPRLLTALQNASTKYFGEWTGVMLEIDEGLLSDRTATLADYGVCSGFYLTVIQGENADDSR